MVAIGAALLLAFPLTIDEVGADGRTNRSDVMGVEQIRPGMKGYGLTVFEGTEPTKFDVEVIDVLHNFRPKQELILVKTFHPRLEVAKVVAGMSGSPIFIDGKMIGAYAYGWSFGAEPIAGVTPIRSMLDDLERPLPDAIYGWPLKPGKLEHPRWFNRTSTRGSSTPNRYAGSPGSYDLVAHRDQLAERHGQRPSGADPIAALAPVSTPLLLGGLSQESVKYAESLLSPMGLVPLQAGGGGVDDPNAPTRYVDGGAVGVQLIRGDISAMGLGTVTRVEGDRLVAFGHPMMNGGVTAMPTAIGKVLWFLASQARSFKIGMPVRPMGAMVNDRQASIVVSHAAKAPVIPVSVQIEGVPGAPYTEWNFDLAHEKFTAPSLVAVALGSALQTTAADRQDVSWNAHSVVRIKGHGEVRLEDFGVAVGGTPDQQDLSRSNLVEAVGTVLNNIWEPAFIESIRVKVDLRYSREIYRLRGAELLTPEVDPGDEARVKLTLVPYSGPTKTRVVAIPIPRHLAGQTVKLAIRPGYAVEKPKATPEDLGELVANLEDPIYPPRSVVLSYREGAGLAHQGHVAHNLPTGAIDLLDQDTSSLMPQLVQSEVHQVASLPYFMVGKESVTIKVNAVVR